MTCLEHNVPSDQLVRSLVRRVCGWTEEVSGVGGLVGLGVEGIKRLSNLGGRRIEGGCSLKGQDAPGGHACVRRDEKPLSGK